MQAPHPWFAQGMMLYSFTLVNVNGLLPWGAIMLQLVQHEQVSMMRPGMRKDKGGMLLSWVWVRLGGQHIVAFCR